MDEFDRALEAVFEDRAAQFSDDLRDLLKQLWREGIKEGRAQERTASPPPFVPQPDRTLFQKWEECSIQSKEMTLPTEEASREMLGAFFAELQGRWVDGASGVQPRGYDSRQSPQPVEDVPEGHRWRRPSRRD